jgi:hypothetical protein
MLTSWMASQAGGADPGPPPADRYVTNDAELTAAIAAQPGTSAWVIELADSGTFNARADISTKSNITLQGETYGGPLITGGVNMDNTTGCKVLGLDLTRFAAGTAVLNSVYGVIDANGASGHEIAYNRIRSNDLDSITMQGGNSPGTYFQGHCGIYGAGMSNFNIHHNDIGDCFRGISLSATAGSTNYIEYNTGLDFYQNPCETTAALNGTIYIRHNSFMGIWANSATDAGAPHSSVMGFSAANAWNVYVIGNILVAATWRRFNSTGSAAGTWGTGSGPKLNSTSSPTYGMHYNAMFAWNICAVDDSLGFEMALGTVKSFYNTVVKDMTSGSAAVPAHNYHDIGAGSYSCKNVYLQNTMGVITTIPGGPNGINSDWITNSWDNVVMQPGGLDGTTSTDLIAYNTHFTGPAFVDLTADNIVAKFTPKVGSYLTSEGIGAIGTGYDWTTRSYGSLPTFTKPKTSNASAATIALTQFDGTNDWLQMNVTAPFLDLANRRTLTQAFYASYDAADTVQGYYSESSSTDFTVRKLASTTTPPSPKMRYRFKNAANAAICELDSSLYQLASEGPNLWVFTVNLTTGRYFIMKGKEIDPFPIVYELKDDQYAVSRTQVALMGQNDVTPPTGTGLVNGRLGLFLYTDEFVDLGVAANHNSIVATNGTPADWGTGGANFTGTQPRGYVYGDATAINAGGGVNNGSSPDKWIINGSVTNA